MHKTIVSLLTMLWAVWAVTACQPSKDKKPDNNNRVSESAQAGAGEPAPGYWRLAGTVGAYPVVMDLAFRPSVDEDYAYYGYHGSYYYRSREDLIDLYGSVDSTGNLVMSEVSLSDNNSPFFQGVFDAVRGAYKGTWTSADGKKQLPFELREDYTDAIRFNIQKFQQASKLFPNQNGSPAATISMIWLDPAAGTDAAAAEFLRSAILRGMVGDSLAALYPSPEKAFEAVSREYFRSYREDMDDVGPDEVGPEGGIMFTYENNSSVEVLYNRNDLLTLGFYSYYFSGGAHGNYSTFLTSYDLQSRKELTLDDVFLPGYESKIQPKLERAVRSRFGLGAKESLGSVLFDNSIAPTENFGLTGKGVIFNYPPYEIAAYAAGEIRLFVPFSEIRDALQPDFVARFVQGQN